MALKHIISVSGGKDSTALWLHALERGIECIPVFADTGHEHPLTMEYLAYLEERLSPIRRVKADFSRRFDVRRKNLPELWRQSGISETHINRALGLLYPTGIPFLDLCMLKGRFPSTKRRFCSQELKGIPIRAQLIEPLIDQGHTAVSWQGIRADESPQRAQAQMADYPDDNLINYRPLLRWTHQQVFQRYSHHGIKPNPLYKLGMTRVGCMPCIHCNKGEMREIATRFPEEIRRVAEWEHLVSEVSKRGLATFFAYDKTANAKNCDSINPGAVRIEEVVRWSKTTRGGKIFDLFASSLEHETCSSIYGLCE